ncbi:MAG: hypothetical protein K8T25_20735 [Planctomycetia bacterium]|nr:hypothetical protein [Planctomycetia bacterium]
MANPTEPQNIPPPRFQFSMRTMFLLVALLSVVCAALGGMFRHAAHGDSLKVYFILATLLAPLGLVVVLAVGKLLFGPKDSGKAKRPKW